MERKKKIMFVCYGGGHVESLLPVIQKLRAEARYQTTVLGLTTARKVLLENGIPAYSISDYISPLKFSVGLKYYRKFHTEGIGVSVAETVSYTGFNIYDLLQEFGKPTTHKLLKNFGRRIFGPVEGMKEILLREKPDLIVTSNCPRVEHAARKAAHYLGIPSLVIEDLTGDTNAFSIMDQVVVKDLPTKVLLVKKGVPENRIIISDEPAFEVPPIFSCIPNYVGIRYFFYADFVAVMGEYTKKNLIARGIDPAGIFITGQPHFDRTLSAVAKSDNEEAKAIRRRYGIPDSKKIVLYLQRLFQTRLEFEAAIRHLSNNPQFQLVIKIHPSESEEEPAAIIREHRSDALLLKDEDLNKLIRASDLVIIKHSSTGIIALLNEKPLLIVNLDSEKEIFPYLSLGLAKQVTEPQELLPAVIQALNEPTPIGRARLNHLIDTEGMATDKVIRLIDNILGNKVNR